MASKTFTIGAKYFPIRDELIKRGWSESENHKSQLLWTNLKLVNFETPTFHWINHFKGSQHFSNKVLCIALILSARLGLRYHSHVIGLFDISPPCDRSDRNLTTHMESSLSRYQASDPNIVSWSDG